jgi:hypothetical protein
MTAIREGMFPSPIPLMTIDDDGVTVHPAGACRWWVDRLLQLVRVDQLIVWRAGPEGGRHGHE